MPATPLRLSGTGLFWATSGDAPATGTLLDVSVQLHACAPTPLQWRGEVRSEEHTSELQSLMRTSYAVFCSKKKNTHTEISHIQPSYTASNTHIINPN